MSPICSNLAFHWSDRYWPICFVISLLREVIRESVGFLLRRMFLSLMESLMCCGSGWSSFLSLPFGMWCLSARRIRLVSVLFAECMLSGFFIDAIVKKSKCYEMLGEVPQVTSESIYCCVSDISIRILMEESEKFEFI